MVWNTILCFSSFLYYPEHAAEDDKGQGPRGSGCAILAQSAVVSKASNHADIKTSAALSQRRYATATSGSEGKAPSKKTPAPSYLQNLRSRLRSSVVVFLLFLNRLSQFCVHRGEQRPRTNMQYTFFLNGQFKLSKDTLIWFILCKRRCEFPDFAVPERFELQQYLC